MPTVRYLGHQIEVRPGTRTSGEVAFVRLPELNGNQRCFLGGEAEARRFLRERKMGPVFGPRAASWEVRCLDTGSSTIVWSAESARETRDYFAGRPVRVTRFEFCPVPGCDGHGEIGERRHGFVVHRPCPRHEPRVEIVEFEGVPEAHVAPACWCRGVDTCLGCTRPVEAMS